MDRRESIALHDSPLLRALRYVSMLRRENRQTVVYVYSLLLATWGEKSPIYFMACKFHFSKILRYKIGSDSSVGVATRYELDGQEIDSRWGGARFSATVNAGSGPHPAYYTMSTGSLPWVKRPKGGVAHPSHLAPRLKEE